MQYIRKPSIKLFFCAVFLLLSYPAHAGDWQITSVFSGKATIAVTNGVPCYLFVNSYEVNAGQDYTFAANTTSIYLLTYILRGGLDTTMDEQSTNCKMTFTLKWLPTNNDPVADPPPAMVNTVVTLKHRQHFTANCEDMGGTVAASAFVSGDSITFPTIEGTATGLWEGIFQDTTVLETKVAHKLTVNNGIAILDVPLSAHEIAKYKGGPVSIPNVCSADAYISASVSVRDAVLTVPDPKVFPETFPTNTTDGRNRYRFGVSPVMIIVDPTAPNQPQAPTWVATFIGVADPTPYLDATTFTSFTIPGVTRTDGPKVVAGNTITQQFTYTNLPANNDDFNGSDRYQKVTLTVASNDISTTQTAHVQIFFHRDSTNHPNTNLPQAVAGAGPIPNWYYYWNQIIDPNVPFTTEHYWGGLAPPNGVTGEPANYPGACYFDTVTNKWLVAIYSTAYRSGQFGIYNKAEGIDFFAHICRHEERHRQDFIEQWGANNGVDKSHDQDVDNAPTSSTFMQVTGDGLHDDKEATLDRPYDNKLRCTFGDDFKYGNDPDHIADAEDYALRRETKWTNGSADKKDWAWPGHQWHN